MAAKFSNVDLNLFRVFDAIYTESNLTRAGEILHITQPSVSNALTRLRNVFDDPLFTHTSQGMMPTPLAKNAIGNVRQALDLLQSALQGDDSFDPMLSEKSFRLSIADLAEAIILPELFERVSEVAPNIRIESDYRSYSSCVKEMVAGTLDFTVAGPMLNDAQLNHELIIEEDYVVMVRTGHPILESKLTPKKYLTLSHIHLSKDKERTAHIDQALYKIGTERKISLWAQHYAMAPYIVAKTDMALTIPRCFAERTNLPFMELPFEVPRIELYLYWHKNSEVDPALMWMKDLLTQLNLGSTQD